MSFTMIGFNIITEKNVYKSQLKHACSVFGYVRLRRSDMMEPGFLVDMFITNESYIVYT